jgi:flagellar biosynthesis GTPase FlhF
LTPIFVRPTLNWMATRTVDDLLRDARTAIGAGEGHLHQAAEDIASAANRGASQRKIADAVGKSAAWVNGLLQWRLGGYKDTAFGPQSAAKRASVQATKHEKPKTDKPNVDRKAATDGEKTRAQTKRAEADKAKAEAATAKAKAAEARAKAAEAKSKARKAKAERDEAFARVWELRGAKPAAIDKASRALLVKFLGMLGSDHQGERDNAAVKADALRSKCNLSWDQLIMRAA